MNQIMNRMRLKISALVLIALLMGNSCAKQVKTDTVVYSNDFESGNLKDITSGTIEVYNGTHVLGRYNKGSFTLNLNGLPKHDIIKISFDLYIHDSWDGNRSFADNAYGPDMWKMQVDNQTYINTTFSNDTCQPGYICPAQSYPLDYPANNNPKTGAFRTDLPGVCTQQPGVRVTTQYKIEKTIVHNAGSVKLQCLDELIDKYEADQKCSESWSIDNLVVKAIAL
ncbi:hypothetical protein MUY27_08815 [Mucilaginibacter sp. RS28]|uniref:Uncharacterized protein n=1 Tax=Mucilaginibacter straminoryzae TaxID=2932774 RepID=A0A9X2BD03_9SPHI|nr:hypothetical protein [Mucilaginibacter straminoryzae]MCJ8209808.1 hypothetical protein [Mucilaginibacter straminoryzae]